MIAAIVPAAGESRRMGRPKLLLPIGGQTVIRRVVTALMEGGVEHVVVVTPPRGAAGSADLGFESFGEWIQIHVPQFQPADMRASFELGLTDLESIGVRLSTILLTPADCPGLTAGLVSVVIARALIDPTLLVIPTFQGRRGHPIALPWELATAVRQLPAGVGVNALVARASERIIELPVEDRGAIDDMDTPEDYQQWLHDEERFPV